MDQKVLKNDLRRKAGVGESGTGNGKMLIIDKFNDELWFSINFVEASASKGFRDDLRIIVRSY